MKITKNPESLAHFELILNAFTVSDIAEPLTVFAGPDESLIAVYDRLMESQSELSSNWFCLVRDDTRVAGYLAVDSEAFEDVPEGALAKEGAEAIEIGQVVPGSMKLIDLVPLFEQHYFFFVLSKNNITHVVSFQDLDKLPTKMAIFTLFLQLESLMIHQLIALGEEKLRRCLSNLSKKRLAKAQDICRLKYKDETTERLVMSTTFVDKKEMLKHSGRLDLLLPSLSNRQVDRLFKNVENVRNQIAHSDSILSVLKSPRLMTSFLSEIQEIIGSMWLEPLDC